MTNASRIAEREAFGSIAIPLIGAGTGGGNEDAVQAIIESELAATSFRGHVVVVRYAPPS